ncbi:2-amino-4-hydroxy-6-hydroxymethyldihydropteridine diphosphokinase [Haloferula sargassicola]|uniref:2-amino-4-hydroxy-6-hydroxymethyldihydropteridine pyrophosphokinase n=1 Tax=Haloferula sargassicola TaxID=490096 RepID=A0ABP9UKZ4_9BACT
MSCVSKSCIFRRAGIALGSNLGDRLAHLRAARDFFREMAGGVLIQASIYQTTPVACPEGSPDFLNTVIEFDFAGSPQDLLAAAMEIERRLGRIRSEKHGPRTLDADLLYLGDLVVSEPELELPHPRLTQRRFVLEPLAEIRPDLRLPGDPLSIAGHLQHLDTTAPPLKKVHTDW